MPFYEWAFFVMKPSKKIILIFLYFLASYNYIFSQNFFRIKADFSIKETLPGKKSRLIMGKVYYDKNYKKLIYDINFPEKETIVITDSFMIIIAGREREKINTPSSNDFSVFHLCLNSNLAGFGLKNSPYTIEKVEKDSDMVITTYLPPSKFSNTLGKVMLSQKQKKLFGIVIFNVNNEVAGKQFFKNYANYSGMEFPDEIVQITYTDKEEFYKVTSFKNVAVNEMQDENMYNYSVAE